jgi:hypothetical protein
MARAWQLTGIMRDKAQNVPNPMRHGHVPSAATPHLRAHSTSNHVFVMSTCQKISCLSAKALFAESQREAA